MICKPKIALSAAALAAALAALPAFAQTPIAPPVAAGAAVGAGGGFGHAGGFGAGRMGGSADAPVAGVHTGGQAGGGIVAPPVRVDTPPIHAAPLPAPQAGGYAFPRPSAHGAPGLNGLSATPPAVPRQPNGLAGRGIAPTPAQIWNRHDGRGHHGRGHWRRGVRVPYAIGDYDPHFYGGYVDEENCARRKVRVYTRHGLRFVWRRVCT